jgi:hypothetical protein
MILTSLATESLGDRSMSLLQFVPSQSRSVKVSILAQVRLTLLFEQIQCSGQRIKYFEKLQIESGITTPLVIPLHSNVHWGTAYNMLERAYHLRQVCHS